MLKKLLLEQYGLLADTIRKSDVGAGSDTYFVTCGKQRYVLKFPSESEINQPELEPALCAYLNEKGIPACRFLRNREGSTLSKDDEGRVFHLQEFFEGEMYALNAAPDWFLSESAGMLGRIHTALKEYQGLPVGIGEGFFRHMTPEKALRSYQKSLMIAEKQSDPECAEDLRYRIGLMERFPAYHFDLSKLTCANTHGDYFISQIICGKDSIRAVIDWTTACIHPVIWEIMRSYVYASPKCAEGSIDIDEFLAYTAAYMETAPLMPEDIQAMAALFYYQIAVCYYYGQYYASTADNREIYLHQAKFSTKLLRWFEAHGEELRRRLEERFL